MHLFWVNNPRFLEELMGLIVTNLGEEKFYLSNIFIVMFVKI